MLPSFDPRPGVPVAQRCRQIDVAGTILILGATISGTMAVNFGGVIYDWNSGRIIGLFITSGLLFVLFALQQFYHVWTTPQNRLFPVQFLHSATMLILFSVSAAAAACLFVPLYMIPLFFQFTRGDSALDAGVRLLPFICFLVCLCLLSGAAMSKFGYYMPWYLAAGILCVTGSALMFTVDEKTSTSKIYGYIIILGAGVGASIQSSFAVAQSYSKPEEIPDGMFIPPGIEYSLTIISGFSCRIRHICPNVWPYTRSLACRQHFPQSVYYEN
jgi:MFS family permease